jgi:chromosome segregation ATPase
MKRQIKFALCSLTVAVFMTGCSNMTDDPRKGGLFSYSPDKYEKRLQEREDRLAAIEEEQAWETKKNSDLRRTKAEKETQVANLRKKVKNEQAKLDSQLRAAKKANGGANSERVEELMRENQQLKKEIAQIEASKKSNEAKRQELERLNRELEDLKAEADALSSL